MIQRYSYGADSNTPLGDGYFIVGQFQDSRNTGDQVLIDELLVAYLDRIRAFFDTNIQILSGYRDAPGSQGESGEPDGFHLTGQAADFIAAGVDPAETAQFAETLGAGGVGLYTVRGYVHIDTRVSKSRWTNTGETSAARVVVPGFGGGYPPQPPVTTPDGQLSTSGTQSAPAAPATNRLIPDNPLPPMQVVIYQEADFEAKPPAHYLSRNEMESWDLKDKLSETAYTSGTITYKNPVSSGDDLIYTFDVPGAVYTKVLTVTEVADSYEEAILLVKSALREANRQEVTLSFTIQGDAGWYAAQNVQVSGFGRFDDKYFIEKIDHAAGNSGYTMQVDTHRCLTGGY